MLTFNVDYVKLLSKCDLQNKTSHSYWTSWTNYKNIQHIEVNAATTNNNR